MCNLDGKSQDNSLAIIQYCIEYCKKGNYCQTLTELVQIEALLQNNKQIELENITKLIELLYSDLLNSGKIPSKTLLSTDNGYILVPNNPNNFIKDVENFRLGLFKDVSTPIDMTSPINYYYDPTSVNQNNAAMFSQQLLQNDQKELAIVTLLTAFEDLAAKYEDCAKYWSNLNPNFNKKDIHKLISTIELRKNTYRNTNRELPDVIFIRDAKAHNAYLIDDNYINLLLNTKMDYDIDLKLPLIALPIIYNNTVLKIHIFQLVLLIQQLYSNIEKRNASVNSPT